MHKHCIQMKDHKGKTTGLMMEGSAMHMSMLHKESAKQERKNLMEDMPVDDKASAMEMSPYKMGHESPAEFTGMSGGSAMHQEEKPEKKKDSVSSTEDKDLEMMKKLQGLNINFDSGAEKPKKQIKKELDKK
jgi:hypothetical protein